MLETARLLHRKFMPADLDALIEMRSDPDVARFIGGSKAQSREWNVNRLAFYIDCYEKYGFGTGALIWKETGEMIGWSGLQTLAERGEVELDYGLVKKFWRRGIGLESAGVWLRYGFETLELENIVAFAAPENIGSWRIMEKLGMTYQNTGEYFGMKCKYYSISKEEFGLYQRNA